MTATTQTLTFRTKVQFHRAEKGTPPEQVDAAILERRIVSLGGIGRRGHAGERAADVVENFLAGHEMLLLLPIDITATGGQ